MARPAWCEPHGADIGIRLFALASRLPFRSQARPRLAGRCLRRASGLFPDKLPPTP